MKTIHHTKVKKLVSQSLEEITHAQNYKDGFIDNWDKNEEMLMTGNGLKDDSTRSKLILGKMRGFTNTLLSKIDKSITFKYKAPEAGDYLKALYLNSLKDQDKKQGNWDFIDLLGKEDNIIYGRTINLYQSGKDKQGNYTSKLSLIDPKDFLIDPEAGGSDKEKALYMGWWGTKITKKQLDDGIKEGKYIKTETQRLLRTSGNNTEETQEDEDKQNRAIKYSRHERILQKDNIFKFYTWFTTDEEDERYYMVLTPSGQCVRCQKWNEIKKSGKYPIWTYAAYPNDREFWTPSPADYVRKIFLSQEKTIRQMIDNSEQTNKPQTIIKPDKIQNLHQLKYNEKSRYIQIDEDASPNEVVNALPVAPLQNAMNVYEMLEKIAQFESGITADVRGVSDEDVLGIYEGNLQQASDRIGLYNKNISDGYREFGILYKEGIDDNLTKPQAVEIMGAEGLEVKKITRKDVRPDGKDYDVVIESSSTDAKNDNIDKKNKLTFINAYKGSEDINQKVLFEKGANIVGFDEDDVKEMLNTQDFSIVRVLREADRIYQDLIKGREVELYNEADTGFQQRLLDLKIRNKNNITIEQDSRVENYMKEIMPIVERNMARRLSNKLAEQGQMEQEIKAGGNLELQEPVEEGIPT
jgi:hypothetical protein